MAAYGKKTTGKYIRGADGRYTQGCCCGCCQRICANAVLVVTNNVNNKQARLFKNPDPGLCQMSGSIYGVSMSVQSTAEVWTFTISGVTVNITVSGSCVFEDYTFASDAFAEGNPYNGATFSFELKQLTPCCTPMCRNYIGADSIATFFYYTSGGGGATTISAYDVVVSDPTFTWTIYETDGDGDLTTNVTGYIAYNCDTGSWEFSNGSMSANTTQDLWFDRVPDSPPSYTDAINTVGITDFTYGGFSINKYSETCTFNPYECTCTQDFSPGGYPDIYVDITDLTDQRVDLQHGCWSAEYYDGYIVTTISGATYCHFGATMGNDIDVGHAWGVNYWTGTPADGRASALTVGPFGFRTVSDHVNLGMGAGFGTYVSGTLTYRLRRLRCQEAVTMTDALCDALASAYNLHLNSDYTCGINTITAGDYTISKVAGCPYPSYAWVGGGKRIEVVWTGTTWQMTAYDSDSLPEVSCTMWDRVGETPEGNYLSGWDVMAVIS